MALSIRGNIPPVTSNGTASTTAVFGAGAGGSILANGGCLLIVSKDNLNTTDGDHSEVTSVVSSLSGVVWTKLKEQTNGQGALRAGITCSLWYGYYPAGCATNGDNVTVTFSSSVTDWVVCGHRINADYPLKIDATNSNVVDGSTTWNSLGVSGLPSAERLYCRAFAREANDATTNGTSGWTSFNATRSRNNASAVLAKGACLVNTSTGESTNGPNVATSGDSATVFAALSEDIPPPIDGTSALSIGAATLSASAFAGDIITGSSALVLGGQTLASTGTAALTVTGDATFAAGASTLAASGASAVPAFTSTSALALGSILASSSGTITAPSFTSTGAVAVAPATLSSSGTSAVPAFASTSALALGSILTSGGGAITAPSFTSTSSLVVAASQLSASATLTNAYTGTSELAVGGISLASSGALVAYLATASLVSGSVLLDATGNVEAPGVTGSSSLVGPVPLFSADGASTVPSFEATAGLLLPSLLLDAAGAAAGPLFTSSAAVVTGSVVLAGLATAEVPVFTGSASIQSPAAGLSAVANTVGFLGSGNLVAPVAEVTTVAVAVSFVGQGQLVISPTAIISHAEITSVFTGVADLSISFILEATGEYGTRVFLESQASWAYVPGSQAQSVFVGGSAAAWTFVIGTDAQSVFVAGSSKPWTET